MRTVLAQFKASKGDGVHEVRKGKDGVVYCTCPSWRFRGHHCKHVEEYQNAIYNVQAELIEQGQEEALVENKENSWFLLGLQPVVVRS